MSAANGQPRCVVCHETATINVHGADPDRQGGHRWTSYCDDHVPAPTDI